MTSNNPSWTGAGPLKYIINHVCTPPELPQGDDTSVPDELHLIKSLWDSVKDFRALEPASAAALSPVIEMLERLYSSQPGVQDKDKKVKLQNMVTKLRDGGKDGHFFLISLTGSI